MSAPESTAPEIRRNDTEHRYEAWVDGEPLAFLFYRQEADRIVLLHTDVLPEAEGRGLGRALARGVLEDVRNRGEEVAPLCPFVASYIKSHSEYADLVPSAYDRLIGRTP